MRNQSVGVIGGWHQEILTSEFSDDKKSLIHDLLASSDLKTSFFKSVDHLEDCFLSEEISPDKKSSIHDDFF